MSDIQRCPHCAKVFDAHTHVSEPDVRPQPGDLSVCLYCAQPMYYDQQGLLRAATRDYLEDAGPEICQQILRVQRAIRRLWEDKARGRRPST